MFNEEEQNWLDSLKVGDSVVIETYGFGSRYVLGVISKISEKKRDFTVGNTKYRSSGSAYGNSYHGSRLIQPTEEVLEIIQTQEDSYEFFNKHEKLKQNFSKLSSKVRRKMISAYSDALEELSNNVQTE